MQYLEAALVAARAEAAELVKLRDEAARAEKTAAAATALQASRNSSKTPPVARAVVHGIFLVAGALILVANAIEHFFTPRG